MRAGRVAAACRRRPRAGLIARSPCWRSSPPSPSGSPSRCSRRRCGCLLAIVVVTTIALYVIYLQPCPHPDQVPRPGHDLPDPVPGHPGRSSRSPPPSPTSVTATAAPRRTRSPPSSAARVQQVARLGRVRPDHRRRAATPPPATSSSCSSTRATMTSPSAATPRVSRPAGRRAQRARQGHRGAGRPGPAERRRGRRPLRASSSTFFVPTANGAIKTQGLSRAFEGRPDPGLRRSLRLHHQLRDRRGLDGRQRCRARSSTRTARRCPRAGRSTSAWRTSPGPSPTRPSPARS